MSLFPLHSIGVLQLERSDFASNARGMCFSLRDAGCFISRGQHSWKTEIRKCNFASNLLFLFFLFLGTLDIVRLARPDVFLYVQYIDSFQLFNLCYFMCVEIYVI